MGPAHSSGGALKEWRITAEVLPSAATEKFGPQRPAVMVSLPCQRLLTLEVAGSSSEIAESATAYSVKRILPSWVHASALAEALRSGVRLVALPPSELISWMSPPMDGSSLIKPSIKAMCWPSGDQAGRAIWREGL